jgi:hypothetical protein
MIDHPKGGYRFLKGSGPYSSGCLAAQGCEVVHAVFHPLPPLDKGFQLIERHLQSLGRPIESLCGMELRIPRPLSIEAFNAFNQPYIDRLKAWGLFIDDLNPVARTNVALEPDRIAQPSVHGFSYTVESKHAGPTLVIAGAGELKASALAASEIVRRGDTSKDGLAEKAGTVLGTMAKRLKDMGLGWKAVTAVDIYCVHNIHEIMESTILPALGEAAQRGVHWYYARPPVIDIDYEMDVRGVRQEIVLPG